MVSRSRQAGFSLIELMAVIMVIGLSLGLASLVISRGGPKDQIWDAIEQFMGLAQFASERALLSGETMGLIMEPPSWQVERGQDADEVGWRYRWVTSSSEGWQDLPNLPAVSFPPGVRLAIEVEGLMWDYDDQLDRTTPIVAYYPSGDITPLLIEITDAVERDFVQHIEVNESGELVWREAPEPPEGDDDAF